MRLLFLSIFVLIPQLATASCYDTYARYYRVDVALLKAIAWTESKGDAMAIGPALPDGNVALGELQINTIHLAELAAYGIEREDLFDGCTSIMLGARELAKCIARFGKVWKAVACFGTGPASKNIAAQKKYVATVQTFYAAYRRQEQARGALNSHAAPAPAKPTKDDQRQANARMVVWNADE